MPRKCLTAVYSVGIGIAALMPILIIMLMPNLIIILMPILIIMLMPIRIIMLMPIQIRTWIGIKTMPNRLAHVGKSEFLCYFES